MKSNGFWLIVLGVIIVGSALAGLLLGKTPAGYARIYHKGILTETINITAVTESFTLSIENDDNINIIEVDYGRIRMLDANCSGKTCVRQGWISGGVYPIVCLPNRVVITLEGSDDGSGIDAVVG